jgi:hypothetical protein
MAHRATPSSSNGGMSKLHEVVDQLQQERGCPIWCIVHCNYGHICAPAIWSVYNARHKVGQGDKIEILLHSGGGHPDIAFTVMKFFRRRFKEVNALVPLTAKSSAALMCLGADHIYTGELADLGPIDIQIDDAYEHGERSFSPLDEFKSMEFLRELSIEWMDYYANLMKVQYGISLKQGLHDSVPLVTGLMRPIFGQIDPIKMGGYRRSIAIGEEYAKRMLALTGNENAEQIIRKMVWEYPSHDFSIDFEEAKELGLPVERLPESQDHKLTAAILNIERDHYHGFVPSRQAAKPVRTVRKGRAAGAGATARRRVNGSDGTRPEERVRP